MEDFSKNPFPFNQQLLLLPITITTAKANTYKAFTCAGNSSKCHTCIMHTILVALGGGYYYHPHFTDEKNE